eukprot:1155609-Pelagomonas_calceolata.AAC.3
MRPGQQSQAAHRQDADLCKLSCAKAVTLHTILLGVGGTCCTEHEFDQFKQLELDRQHASNIMLEVFTARVAFFLPFLCY